DSPITVEDRLEDLVTFVNFNDTTEYIPAKAQKAQNVDMSVIISIEQAAQVNCLLSEDGHDYVKLEGGGDLTMTYNTQNDLRMYGRYTIISGSMNYTLISVVNKSFDIENGSYVEFTGDIMNPTLKISANERMKATYSENNIPRSVTFDVGLNITQTLKNMGLEFTLDAPEDMTVQNELASMSSEDRGRVAVTMMATNMYITDLSNTAGFNTSNALNSFLQSEINNLVGMAQNTIDVNFGIENNTSETGRNQTDYNFSFAKRFWGNRINLIVGGKVSTGADAVNTGESIIDNVSLEYRLDQSATRYVKVYYDRNYESLLEGELAEMGAGVVFRKKSKRLRDIFRFRNKKKEAQTFKVQERKP
ncbi:MAG: translocation/assembly module TamB domain-containing protein, partial [Bacteroidaceae bacterium]|nr:translocation/assembly module TamB domain-containing protein [Bacteroidaceae bacterium]